MHNLLGECLPNDHSRQVSAWTVAESVLGAYPDGTRLLDLGCGRGESRAFFLERRPSIAWIGLDIEQSPEVNQRQAAEGDFRSYDGVNIPFEDGAFDLIFSRQTFEHVQFPHEVMKQVARVLRPGGVFFGSTSQLEPYHSYSTFGYSPHGWRFLIEDVAGMKLVAIRPGIDAITLMTRRALGAKGMNRWFERDSPLNSVIGAVGALRGRTPRRINSMKLRFAGQFGFIAVR